MDSTELLLLALMASIVVLIIVGTVSCINNRDENCTAKGGTYLAREGKCVRGIEEIK